MKVRVVLSVDVDLQAWREEYSNPDETPEEVRAALRSAIQTAAATPGIVVPEGIIREVEDLS